MATFIPPYMGEEIKSNAEIKMYDILQGLDMREAYILHSLGLPKHQSKIYGEIDFVVVCERGIACLEIKGGRVERRDGRWIFTDRYGRQQRKREGPFAQVIGNMFSLRECLRKQFRSNMQGKNILMACGVVFPDIKFTSQSEEIIPEIVFDRRTKDITAYINAVFDYWKGRQHQVPAQLSASMVKEIVNYLRGEFTFVPVLADRLEHIERRLIRLTEEQSKLMDALSQNEHLLIEGSAGTGKTLLATDFAIKEANKGKKVIYLTYNKNLSYSILASIRASCNLKIINIHALFGEYVEINEEQVQKEPKKYFEEILPKEFYQYIDSLDREELTNLQYDLLVMDEGQDIIKPDYLCAIDRILKNGLEKGHWAIFYDEQQNIYNQEYQNGMKALCLYASTKFRLYVNCRNTIQIGTFTTKASGILLKDYICENGEEVQIVSYADDSDYEKKIRDILAELKKEEVRMRDVVFLAAKRYKKTRLSRTDIKIWEIGGGIEKDLDAPFFSTIHSYKGLDSKIVILCEVDDIYTENYAKLMYIAATRARTLLYIVGSENFWEEHKEIRIQK